MPEFTTGAGELTVWLSLTGLTRWMACTFGYTAADEPTTAELNGLFADFKAAYDTEMDTNYVIERINSRYQVSPSTVIVGQSTSGRLAMAGGTAGASPNVAVLVKKTTGVAGRKNRGRFYLPGVIESQLDDLGKLTTTARNNWQADSLAWFNSMTTHDLNPVINHSDLSVPTTVDAYDVQELVATQRRRLRP